jgi:hypothetical protein
VTIRHWNEGTIDHTSIHKRVMDLESTLLSYSIEPCVDSQQAKFHDDDTGCKKITREEGQKLIAERYRTMRTERKVLKEGVLGGTRLTMESFEVTYYRSRGRMLLSVFLNGSERVIMSSSRVTSTSPGSGLLGLSCR